MDAILTEAFLAALVAGTVTAATPLLLAGLGEQLSERAGVLNVGLEGMMLAGAYAGFLGAFGLQSHWLGFGCGMLGGMLVAGVMALCCVWGGLNQIVVGIGLTLSAEGITSLLHHVQFSRLYPRLPTAQTLELPFLADLPVLGQSLFSQHPVVYLVLAAVLVCTLLYRFTHLGLTLQAAGDSPEALDVAGIDVARTRGAVLLVTGSLAGLGGAFLAQIGAGLFVPFMTNGAGFIGIVLAMLARGRPLGVLLGALLFGAALSLTTVLQIVGVNVPTDAVQMLPFAAVMLALVLFGRRARLPAALGQAYIRGRRI